MGEAVYHINWPGTITIFTLLGVICFGIFYLIKKVVE